MADPISLSASVIAVASACTATARYLIRLTENFLNAPKELVALSNEVSDLSVLLPEVQRQYCIGGEQPERRDPRATDADHGVDKALESQLGLAKQCLMEMDEFLKAVTTESACGQIYVNRIAWVRKKSKIGKLRSSFESARHNIHLILTIKSSALSQRVENAIMSLYQDITQTSSIQVSPRRVELEQSFEPDIVEQSTPEPRIMLLASDPNKVSIEQLQTWQTRLYTQMTFQASDPDKCVDTCVCLCHVLRRPVRRLRAPNYLNIVFGFLFATYSGLPYLQPGCSTSNCRNYSRFSSRLTYCFPRWAFAAAIHFAAGQATSGELMTLRVQRRIPETEENGIFVFVKSGNIGSVKMLFDSRQASLGDTDYHAGHTALHHSVMAGQIEMAKFLLSYGADPDMEQDTGISVCQTVWSRILTLGATCSCEEKIQLQVLFPESRSIERFNFSDLHKSILGLLPTDLDVLLAKPIYQSFINHQDIWDRTPLCWAAKRGDARAVKSLIHAGADVNIQDCTGSTPTHYAAGASNLRSLELFLMARSETSLRNWLNHTPMHYAIKNNVPHIELLLHAGASLQTKGRPLLHDLAWSDSKNKSATARYIVQQGSDLELCDSTGCTALFIAVEGLAYDCVELLIASHCNVKHVNKDRDTILHFIAKWGDSTITEIFRRVAARGLDIGAVDRRGRTALEVLEHRSNKPDDFSHSFQSLLAGIEDAAPDEEGVEEFHDIEME